jgi:hypothetical protein
VPDNPKQSAAERERRVGESGRSFEDGLTEDAKKHIPAIEAEFREKGHEARLVDRNTFYQMRLSEIYKEPLTRMQLEFKKRLGGGEE